jgi:hypothetical protein
MNKMKAQFSKYKANYFTENKASYKSPEAKSGTNKSLI